MAQHNIIIIFKLLNIFNPFANGNEYLYVYYTKISFSKNMLIRNAN